MALRLFTGFAKIVWWINGAWVLVAFVRLFLISNSTAPEVSSRAAP